MLTTLPTAQRSNTASVIITWVSIQWTTFQALMAELGEDLLSKISYDLETAESAISQIRQPDLGRVISLSGTSWKTYQALMTDIGDGRAWRKEMGRRAAVRLFRSRLQEILQDSVRS